MRNKKNNPVECQFQLVTQQNELTSRSALAWVTISTSDLLLVRLHGEMSFDGLEQILVSADELFADGLHGEHGGEHGHEIILHLHFVVVHHAIKIFYEKRQI